MNRKHGGSRTKLYYKWQWIKQVCDNPKHPQYKSYGAEGIGYSPEFISFAAFQNHVQSLKGYNDPKRSLVLIEKSYGFTYGNMKFSSPYEKHKARRP
jgi:hypothetical protein